VRRAGQLTSAITSLHLATLAGSTTRSGILVCDVSTSRRAPGLDAHSGNAAQLEAFVAEQVQAGSLALHPDPRSLLAWLATPGLARLVAEPELTLPWLWDLGDVRQLVYAVTFRHPDTPPL
jgi:hypothetical protein